MVIAAATFGQTFEQRLLQAGYGGFAMVEMRRRPY
jgi:hypothetical protein